MTADWRKIDQKTVERYLSVLCEETLFVYEVKRFNIKGRQLLNISLNGLKWIWQRIEKNMV